MAAGWNTSLQFTILKTERFFERKAASHAVAGNACGWKFVRAAEARVTEFLF
jgi:hypothetical protein